MFGLKSKTDDFGLIIVNPSSELRFILYSRNKSDVIVNRLYIDYMYKYPTYVVETPMCIEAQGPIPHKYHIRLVLDYKEYDIIPLTPNNTVQVWQFRNEDEEHFDVLIGGHACAFRICIDAYDVKSSRTFSISSKDIYLEPFRGNGVLHVIDKTKKKLSPTPRRLLDSLSPIAYKLCISYDPKTFLRSLSIDDIKQITKQDEEVMKKLDSYFYTQEYLPYVEKYSTISDGSILNRRDNISILFCAADPTDASRLRLGEEFREINEKLKMSQLRDRFKLEIPQLSVRPADISQALLDIRPQIVHFSGHGTSTGALCFENQTGQTQLVQPDALAALFEQFAKQVKCVLLNACYSETQAKAIGKHIKYVIGMNQAIGDKAAIAFAIGFYQALGAGRTIEDAYKLGCVQIRLQGIPEHLTPVLIKEGQLQP